MDNRHFLFLQGPPGPLFASLAKALRGKGVSVTRINLSLGDQIDWQGDALNYRRSFSSWPMVLDDVLRQRGITDILLFGDCRPYHMVAHRIARLRGINVHVLEEGYLRPHWMTLERDGVNARSRLSRHKGWFRTQARSLPPETPTSPVTASFKRRARDAFRYYTAVQIGRPFFPFYRNHRMSWPIVEGFGWLWKFATRGRNETRASAVIAELADRPFFLFPLQLSGDYQIRSHSPFPDMWAATRYVMKSFAEHAPKDTSLLVKAHPLDSSFTPWRWRLRRKARALGIADRVLFIDGGDLEALSEHTRGMVCVNSTSATLALRANRPVCVIGDAIYKVPGLVFDGHIDQFWKQPKAPEAGLYEAFRRVLVRECLVRGGLASQSAVTTLVESMTDKLLDQGIVNEGSQSSTAEKWLAHVGGE